MTERLWRAGEGVSGGEHGFDLGDAVRDGGAGSAFLLNGGGADVVAGGERDDVGWLVLLAAEAEHEHGGEVGMVGIAGGGAAENVGGFSAAGHAAAGGVSERDDAVDVREIGETLGLSADTVHMHAKAVFARLGARNRAGAVSVAYDCGLLRTRAMRDERAVAA